MAIPRLYAIIDADLLAARSIDISWFATELRYAGVMLAQYRNKRGSARAMLDDAALLRKTFDGKAAKLIFNDRADLALLSGFDGVHAGQDDLSADDARGIVGANAWIGVSTHTAQQVIEADATSCDYIAYGPVFPTASKNNPDPIVGLDGLRMARSLTRKPLVAIGGITHANCRSVIEAGADSVAVISGLLSASGSTRDTAEQFIALLS